MEWLKNAKNFVFLNVPYETASQAFQAVVAGEVQVAVFASRLGMPQAKAGRRKGRVIPASTLFVQERSGPLVILTRSD